MKRSLQFVVIISIIVLIFGSIACGQDELEKKPWTGKLGDGTEVTESDLQNIVKEHVTWLSTIGEKGKKVELNKANLLDANLKGAMLSGADLGEAYLEGANLSGALLGSANLRGAKLGGANLSEANLVGANLSKAYLAGANLSHAILGSTNLIGAYLGDANLNGTILNGANLSHAIISNADLTGCSLDNVRGFPLPEPDACEPVWGEMAPLSLPVYEPKAGSVPDIQTMVQLSNLEHLSYHDHPHGLIDLREGFKKLGYKEQERKIIFALKHTETEMLLNSEKFFDRIEGRLRLYLFEYTSKWGMSPGRPLFMLIWLILPFSLVYMFSLIGIDQKDGIWKFWIENRARKDLGQNDPELLYCEKGAEIWGYGIYFSILSAFNIGWRELNVGNWIARVQPREYTLRASGWVRTVSGIQSLISVYLLALAVLTYFGRPFDQF